MDSSDLFKKSLTILAIILAIKFVFVGGLFKGDGYDGRGYTIKFPPGWVLSKQKSTKNNILDSAETPEIVTYQTPEINSRTQQPEASMAVTTFKLRQATWIEDEFPYIISSLEQARMHILDKGQIKIDERITQWALYQDKYSMLHLEFYFVDDANIFYKIAFVAHPNSFKVYRPAFEAAKDTFKFKGFNIG